MTYWTRPRLVDQFETLTVKVGVFLLSLLGISTTLFRSSKHRTPLHAEFRSTGNRWPVLMPPSSFLTTFWSNLVLPHHSRFFSWSGSLIRFLSTSARFVAIVLLCSVGTHFLRARFLMLAVTAKHRSHSHRGHRVILPTLRNLWKYPVFAKLPSPGRSNDTLWSGYW